MFKMPPQAGGFRYTPTSYLQKSSRVENRPWNDSATDDDQFHIITRGQAAIKKGSRDEHFQSRVARKKNAYREMLKRGDDSEVNDSSHNAAGMDDEDFNYNNPDTYFDSGYGSFSTATGSGSYGRGGGRGGDIYYGSTNESSNGSSSFGGGLPQRPHSRAYTETCNRYSDVSSVQTEQFLPSSSSSTQQPDLVSPSLMKVAARVARQKRIQEESKQHRLAEARRLALLHEKQEKLGAPKRQVSASPARSSEELESSAPLSSSNPERINRAYRNRRIIEASQDERERLEELRERRAREEEQAARRAKVVAEEKKRRENEAAAAKSMKRDKDLKQKKRSKQFENQERKQREAAAAAAKRSAEEDRKTQEIWRKSSLEVLQKEKRAQRAKASLSSKSKDDSASRRSRGSRSSSSKSNSVKERSPRGRTRTRFSHELPTNAAEPLSDVPPDMTLMEEFHELLRESGFFRTCVSSCFGEEGQDFQQYSERMHMVVGGGGAPCGEDTSQSDDSSSPIEL